MTNSEFSAQFDVLWNNVTSNQAPGVNEYEKSVFLTKAQSQLVNEYFNNRTDGFGGGFDGSQKRQYDFSGLVRVESLHDVTENADTIEKLDRRSKVYLFPQDYFLAVNEILSDGRWQYSVIPLSYAEYQRVMTKPYNFPIKRGAWRIFTNKKSCNTWNEYVKIEDGSGNEIITPIDYSFVSSWVDSQRNLKIHISVTNEFFSDPDLYPSGYAEELMQDIDSSEKKCFVCDVDDKISFMFEGTSNKLGKLKDGVYFAAMSVDCYWSNDEKAGDDKTEYPTTMIVDILLRNYTVDPNNMPINADDEKTIAILQEGFEMFAKNKEYFYETGDPEYVGMLDNALAYTDGFIDAKAPSNFNKFQTKDSEETLVGYSFTTTVNALPMAEIIGKFHGNLKYQLRYIRTLTPIILEDLTNYGDDITIDGVTAATECALPVETHQEILERAVTLAKIAWQGGTMTQAAAKDNS